MSAASHTKSNHETQSSSFMKSIFDLRKRYHTLSRPTQLRMLWTALLAVAVVAFLELAHLIQLNQAVNATSWIQALDERILVWAESTRTPFMNIMMLDVSSLGGLALTVVLGFVAVVLFILSKDAAAAMLI
jgi:hypothetical protein